MAIADGVLELKFDEELNRRMRIRNMRGCITSSQWIPFETVDLGDASQQLLEWKVDHSISSASRLPYMEFLISSLFFWVPKQVCRAAIPFLDLSTSLF